MDVDGGALEEVMECELEDGTVQDADRVRSISNPRQPSRKNVKSMSNTCAVPKLVHCMRERTWRSTGAGSDEGKLHTFARDFCFPSQGSQQGITVLVIKETKTKAICTFMVPEQKCQ